MTMTSNDRVRSTPMPREADPRARRPATQVTTSAPSGPLTRPSRRATEGSGWATIAAKAGGDGVAVGAAMALAFRFRTLFPGSAPSTAGAIHFRLGLIALPLWITMFWRQKLYSERHTAGRLDEFHRLVHASVASVAGVALIGFLVRAYASRGWLVLTIPLAIALVEVERAVARRTVNRLRAGGHLLQSVVIVGGNAEALSLCAMLTEKPSLGYRPLGFVADEERAGAQLLAGQAVLGRLSETVDIARAAGANSVILATTSLDPATSNRLTRELNEVGIGVELSSSLCDIAAARLLVRPLGRFPVVYVAPVRRHGWRSRAKRSFDVAGALVLGALASPLLLLTALAVRLDSAGPVLFRQKRVGQDGRIFEVLKFRTMVPNAEELAQELKERNQADGPLFKLRRDPRVTRCGRILRALSIDEFPQLWNVLRNEMSLVGPRPAIPSEVDLWSPELHHRLAVKPGMTGMWQVSSDRWRSFDEYARLDLYYVDNWSIWTDLAILVKTPFAMLFQSASPHR